MLQIPEFVLDHLLRNQLIRRTRILIIVENYPRTNYETYFYRSLPNVPGGPIGGVVPQFFQRLCNTLQIPSQDNFGIPFTEIQRLTYFLNNGFLLIDAQPNGAPPVRTRPDLLNNNDLNMLIRTIQIIEPINIMFLTNNNINVINQISEHPDKGDIISKIIINPTNNANVFAFPAPPADPNLFINQILRLRQDGFQI